MVRATEKDQAGKTANQMETKLWRWFAELPVCALIIAGVGLSMAALFVAVSRFFPEVEPYSVQVVWFVNLCRWLLMTFGIWFAGTTLALWRRDVFESRDLLRGAYGCVCFFVPMKLFRIACAWCEAVG